MKVYVLRVDSRAFGGCAQRNNRVMMRSDLARLGRLIRGLLLSIGLGLWGHAGVAAAPAVLQETAMLLEPGARWGIDQVLTQHFTPHTGVVARGYTRETVWLRLRLNPPPQGDVIQLRIRPTFLDDVRVYRSDGRGGWSVQQSGDAFPVHSEDRLGPSLGFRLPFVLQAETVYVRIHTTSSMLVSVDAAASDQAFRSEMRMLLWQLMYAGFMLWILFWALQDTVINRSKVALAFMGYQVGNLIYAVLVLGYGATLAPESWGSWSDKGLSYAVILSVSLGLIFHRAVFLAFGAPTWVRRLFAALIALEVGVGLAFAWGYEREALSVSSSLVLLAGPLFFGFAWRLDGRADSLVRVVRWVYGVQAFSVLFSMVPLLGLGNFVEWALYAPLLHGWIAALLMYFMLSMRALARMRAAEAIREQSALAMQELRLQREHSAEQARFMDMLTHELKTPVAVGIMSLEGLRDEGRGNLSRVKRALANINAIVERARWSDAVSRQRLQVQALSFNLPELALEVVDTSLEPERVQLHLEEDMTITSDPQLLTTVLSNLLDNALKYSPPKSQVSLTVSGVSRAGRMGALVTVRNPIGVAGVPETDRVFEKYYRRREASGISGSGLGLYLSRQLTQMLGGDLLWSHDNRCVEFELWLPH